MSRNRNGSFVRRYWVALPMIALVAFVLWGIVQVSDNRTPPLGRNVPYTAVEYDGRTQDFLFHVKKENGRGYWVRVSEARISIQDQVPSGQVNLNLSGTDGSYWALVSPGWKYDIRPCTAQR